MRELRDELAAYGLPGGSELGLKNPALSIVDNHEVVEGELGIRP